jgi:hypothetical protein
MARMDEKPRRSWLLLAVINSAALGVILAGWETTHAVKVAGAVIAFGPIPLAIWLDTRSGLASPTKAQFVTLVVLIVALIAVIALWPQTR